MLSFRASFSFSRAARLVAESCSNCSKKTERERERERGRKKGTEEGAAGRGKRGTRGGKEIERKSLSECR